MLFPATKEAMGLTVFLLTAVLLIAAINLVGEWWRTRRP